MRPMQFSRTAALIVGVCLPVIETWRRWGTGSHIAAWLDDFIAGVLLLYAWRMGRAELALARPYLMAAWAYTFGIAYMSFFGDYLGPARMDPSGFSREIVLGFKAFGIGLSSIALAAVWRERR